MKKFLSALFIAATLCIGAFAQNTNQFFSVTAPVELTASAPVAGYTDNKQPYTVYNYTATLSNEDTYMVEVAQYNFATTEADLQRVADGFVGSLLGAKVLKSGSVTAGDQPALMQTIEVPSNNRVVRLAWLGTYKGNRFYQFVFGTYADAPGTDMTAVGTFFGSIVLN